MTRTFAELIEHRVSALGYVLLTRRDDIVITELAGQPELDLLARLKSRDERRMRFFGVILKGTEKPLDDENASRELNAQFRSLDKGKSPMQYPFPVLTLILSMENDQGFYAWRSEPLSGAHSPSLRVHRTLRCKNFTKSSLNDIVRSINGWYDLLFESLSSHPE
jgi:hypothetical protein